MRRLRLLELQDLRLQALDLGSHLLEAAVAGVLDWRAFVRDGRSFVLLLIGRDEHLRMRQRIVLLMWIAVVSVILWQTQIGSLVLYPFTILATWFHEMGHGIAAIVTGASFERLLIFPDGSGLAQSILPASASGLTKALIAASGPLGPAIAGSLLIIASRTDKATRMALTAVGLALIISTVIWVQTLIGWLILPALVFVAYRFKITFLLVLALIEFFHWVGSWTSMWGRGTYVLEVQDPRLMSAAALAVIGIGVWHEQALADRTGRFFAAYESLGLVYLDLSLLILSIDGPSTAGWVLLFTAATLGEILAGAMLRNPLLLGFGVTFLCIDGFTRFYETFWNSWEKATFFLAIGLLTFGCGAACELALRSARGREAR